MRLLREAAKGAMDRILERCCGVDVGKSTVMRVPSPEGGRQQIIRMFGTTTPELLTLREWLEAHRVTHVAMESTGVYGNRSTACSKEHSMCCWSTPPA